MRYLSFINNVMLLLFNWKICHGNNVFAVQGFYHRRRWCARFSMFPILVVSLKLSTRVLLDWANNILLLFKTVRLWIYSLVVFKLPRVLEATRLQGLVWKHALRIKLFDLEWLGHLLRFARTYGFYLCRYLYTITLMVWGLFFLRRLCYPIGWKESYAHFGRRIECSSIVVLSLIRAYRNLGCCVNSRFDLRLWSRVDLAYLQLSFFFEKGLLLLSVTLQLSSICICRRGNRIDFKLVQSSLHLFE